MTQRPTRETMLGRLGTFLDSQNASHFEIIDEDLFCTVVWEQPGSSRQQCCFRDVEIEQIWQVPGRQEASGRWAPLLAALGRGLDNIDIDVARIAVEMDGFLVTGSSSGRYLTLRFGYPELGGMNLSPFVHRTPPTYRTPMPATTPRDTPRPVALAVALNDNRTSPLRRRLQLL
ncbi:MAG TPA: hypothetical protein VFC51_16930 [Chloroflexota bacterium]|nr:hypothetical protein [Chloroflexota bacterium]